jgi:hypothetical protein
MSETGYKAAYLAGRAYINELNQEVPDPNRAHSAGKEYTSAIEEVLNSEHLYESGLSIPAPSLQNDPAFLEAARKSWAELTAKLSESKQQAVESLASLNKELALSSFYHFRIAYSAAFPKEYTEVTSQFSE